MGSVQILSYHPLVSRVIPLQLKFSRLKIFEDGSLSQIYFGGWSPSYHYCNYMCSCYQHKGKIVNLPVFSARRLGCTECIYVAVAQD